MRTVVLILMLQCIAAVVTVEKAESKDLDIEDNEALERGHRKRKKHGQGQGCGYGRTFGEKFFGLADYTYVSAPVMNYFFGCGVAALPVAAPAPIVPVAPIAPVQPFPAYPISISQSQSQSGGHHHLGHHGNGGFGGGGFGGNYGYNPGFNPGLNQRPGFNQGFNQRPGFNQGYPPNRPFQGAVSAAASGLGTALADYISRPKTQKQINRQLNQFFKPLYKLF